MMAEAPKFNSESSIDPKDDMSNTDLDRGLSLAYEEGSGYTTHRENPEYYHVPRAAKKSALTYLGSLKDGESPTDEAQQLFGLKKNTKGQWFYSAPDSKVGRTKTLGDYMVLPLVSKTFTQNKNFGSDVPAAGTTPTRKLRLKEIGDLLGTNITLGDGLRQPQRIIGPDAEGNLGYDRNRNLRGLRAGQYEDSKGNVRLADPLKWMGQQQFEIESDYSRLINSGETDIGEYWKAGLKNGWRHHGRKSVDGDRVSKDAPNQNWHGLPEGAKPTLVHRQINTVVHNMAENHNIDEKRLPGSDPKLASKMRDRLDEAKTASFVKCNCPACVLDQSAHPENQYWDMQWHNKAATSTDKKVRDAYKAGFPVAYSGELGSMTDMGKVAMTGHHRIFWPSDSAKRYIHHVVKFNQEEQDHANVVKPTTKTMSLPYVDAGDLGHQDMSEMYEGIPSALSFDSE